MNVQESKSWWSKREKRERKDDCVNDQKRNIKEEREKIILEKHELCVSRYKNDDKMFKIHDDRENDRRIFSSR